MNAAVIGASGYTGLELIKILLNHKKFTLSYIGTTNGGETLTQLHPSLQGVTQADIEKSDPKQIAKIADIAFLALPHQTSMSYAKELLDLGIKVVDLSADYRINLQTYEKHYCVHEDKENLLHAVYGLPELNKDKIKSASLVANPGCYPTASILGILPFAKMLKKDAPIFIDAKSGVSGAGKKLSQTSHFVTINDNIFAYNPLKHRHSPEIKEKIDLQNNLDNKIIFVPHLLPITRGMLVDCYFQIDKDINAYELLQEYYLNEKFVRIRKEPTQVKNVAGTNFCDLHVMQDGNIIFINSCIDNLLRGASSQAVVNANLMCGFDEDEAIPTISYAP